MKFHQGNEVKVTFERSELSVSNTRVRPYEDKVIESEDTADLDEKVNDKGDGESEGKEKKCDDKTDLEKEEEREESIQLPRRSQRIINAKNVKLVEVKKGEKREETGEKRQEREEKGEKKSTSYFARLIKEIYTGVKSLDQLLVNAYTEGLKDKQDRDRISDFKFYNTKDSAKNTKLHENVHLGSLPSLRHQRQRVGSMSELRDHIATDYVHVPYYPQYCN